MEIREGERARQRLLNTKVTGNQIWGWDFPIPVILGDLYSPIISWDFLFSSSPVSAHDDVSGSKVVSRGCVVTFWTSNGADKVDFCHLKSP